jgi:hypothetical protein
MSHVQSCGSHAAQAVYSSRSSEETGLMEKHIQEALKEGRPLRPAELAFFGRLSLGQQRELMLPLRRKYELENAFGKQDSKLGALYNQLVGAHRATEQRDASQVKAAVASATAQKTREQQKIDAFVKTVQILAKQHQTQDTLVKLAVEEHRGRAHHRGSRPASDR